jgi:hypothetical protein
MMRRDDDDDEIREMMSDREKSTCAACERTRRIVTHTRREIDETPHRAILVGSSAIALFIMMSLQ